MNITVSFLVEFAFINQNLLRDAESIFLTLCYNSNMQHPISFHPTQHFFAECINRKKFPQEARNNDFFVWQKILLVFSHNRLDLIDLNPIAAPTNPPTKFYKSIFTIQIHLHFAIQMEVNIPVPWMLYA